MEENPVPEVPAPEEPQSKRFFGFGAENTKWVLIFLLILLSLAGGLFLNLRGNSTNKPPQKTEDTSRKNEFIAPNSVVYGYWTKENSVIAVLDLSTNQNNILAQLPLNIKHVRIVDPGRIVYIKDTDDRDYGKEIVIRELASNTETVILKVDEGFGIDDYVISPSARYLAVWEVSPSEGGTQLFGGKSRVYTADTQKPLQKNLIFDETSGLGITLAYPIAITDKGDLFTDRFLPNSGAGWGYGVAVSDFSGSSKQDITSLSNGMISTQPEVSPDGKNLLFAGYDGRKGSGTIETDGFRRAILSSNTLEVFDLGTRQKKTLLTTSGDDIFSDPNWDRLTGNIVYRLISKNDSLSGIYFYSFNSNSSQKINIENLTTAARFTDVLTMVSENKYLAVDKASSDSELGNLGGKYSQQISALYLLDIAAQSKTSVNLEKGLVQLIDLKAQNYFPSQLLVQGIDKSRNQIQLQTFEIKPSLAPKRLVRQSDPVPPQPAPSSAPKHVISPNACYARAAAQCNEILSTDYPLDIMKNRQWDPDYPEDPEFQQCFHNAWLDLAGSCADSPLYLYGEEGRSVKVYSTTPVYPLNTSYSPTNGFAAILGESGTFTVDGKGVSSIEFDYEPAIKVEKPKTGYLIAKENLIELVEKISNQLGLNEKETEDTLDSLKEKAVSSYVFISLFDDQTSKKILPLVISPTPDTYRNIVFYIENFDENPNTSYAQPVIEKIQRKGFTAVEISFIAR